MPVQKKLNKKERNMGGPYFLPALLAAKQARVMVSVYFTDDPDSHMCGYVLDATSDGITLEHYTPDACPDGQVLVRTDRVFHVDIDGRYERRIALLAKHYSELA